MRFVADENVSRRVVRALREAGHDVLAIKETTPGIIDRDVLSMAGAADRVLITEDQDFGELVVRHGLPVAGVLLLRLDPLSPDAETGRVLEIVLEQGSTLDGHFIVAEPGRIRRRPLSSR